MPHPSREVGGVENVGKRQFAVRCHLQVWRFDVENDDDVRDAVVADDGGGGERRDGNEAVHLFEKAGGWPYVQSLAERG